MALPSDPNGRDREDPGPFPRPRLPTAPIPRGQLDPGIHGSDKANTAPETGRAIPILHGTAKVQGTVVEQYSGILYSGFLKAPYWLPNNTYSIGDRVTANGNSYVATKAGISAGSGTGPTGTGTNIIDGNTAYGVGAIDISVRWNFVSLGTTLFWTPNTLFTVNLLTTVVLANGNFYLCVGTGTSAATGTGPTGTGTGITDGTCTWNYMQPGWRVQMAVAFCEGQIFGGKAGYSDAGIWLDYNAILNDGIQLYNGTPTGIGARPAWFPTPDSVQRDDYANTAVLLVNAATGSDNKITNVALEIASGTGVDATHKDENPADIIIDLLTHARRGAGWLAGKVDSAVTLGAGAASYRTYCTANGLLMSWVIDQQTTAMDLLQQLLSATNADAYWSGGVLKFSPRGDQALTANGVTFTPVSTPVYNLTQDDIIGVVSVERKPPATQFNAYPVEYTDRAAGYVRLTVTDPEMANIDLRGMVKAPTVALPQVISPASAVMLSRIFAQRSLKICNTYSFKLPRRFFLLDPTDIVTLSDSISGMSLRPVRITSIEEDQSDASFNCTAEDYPVAVSAAAQYTPQTGDGFGPLRKSTVGQATTLPSRTSAATVTDSTSTRGPAVYTMWPNAGSEDSPPDGADATRPEWATRVLDGTAFGGNWVRQLTPVVNTRVVFGDDGDPASRVASAAVGFSMLGLLVRCSPGDVFSFSAMARITTGTAAHVDASVAVDFLDKNKAQLSSSANGGSIGSPWKTLAAGGQAPTGASYVWFGLVSDIDNVSVAATIQFDAISAIRITDSQSDAASNAPALTLAAGGNVFTDTPGTSQSFTPVTASRKIKVSLCFSGFSPIVGGTLNVRIVFGGTPTQAGSTYNFSPSAANQHLSWSFMWALAPGLLGPVGTAVTVKAQIRSPGISSFTMDANDSVAMVIEEIG